MRKKLLCLLLCMVMTAALFVGCAPSEGGDTTPKANHVLQAGYGRVDVTPEGSMPLAGLAARNSDGVLDPLYITCVALKDEAGNTFLLYHTDFLKAFSALTYNKTVVSKKTGVPMENIVVAGTHNHSAPHVDDPNSALIPDYQKLCKDAMIDSATTAIADLKPATMYITSKKCENMTFVRHFVRKNGTIHGSGGSAGEAASYVGYASEVDDNMELIKFVREGGKDILLMNWQGHPRGHSDADASYTGVNRKNKILSDVHHIRTTVEEGLDCHFAFFLGASGNVNNLTRIKEHMLTYEYIGHNTKLGELAIEAAADFKEAKTGTLKKVTTKVTAEYKAGGTTNDIPISVVSIGETVAFVIAPYEMFSESSLELKEASNFDMTYIVTCADSHFGYMPTLPTFDYDVEAYEVGATEYMPGTAEDLVEGYKTLLNQLKPSAS